MKQTTFDDLEVSSQGLLEDRVPEETALGDVAHKELDDNRELMDGLVKPRRGPGRRRPTDSLLQIGVRCGVVQLYGLDAAEVVVVPRMLWIAGGGGECGL